MVQWVSYHKGYVDSWVLIYPANFQSAHRFTDTREVALRRGLICRIGHRKQWQRMLWGWKQVDECGETRPYRPSWLYRFRQKNNTTPRRDSSWRGRIFPHLRSLHANSLTHRDFRKLHDSTFHLKIPHLRFDGGVQRISEAYLTVCNLITVTFEIIR